MSNAKRILAFCAALAGAVLASPASATVYQGSISGIDEVSSLPGSATYTIETDGALGALGSGDFLGGTISGDVGSTHFSDTFTAADVLYIDGISATSTQLLFDFAGTGAFALFDGDKAICFNGVGTSCIGNPPGAIAQSASDAIDIYAAPTSDVIASAVPAPSTLSLMLAGFALLVMAAVRRRKPA